MGEELKDPPTPQEAVAAAIAVEAIQATRGAGSVELLQSNPNKRYSFACFLVNAGCSLYEVQLMVGHSQIKVTQRYSHLSQESLLRAAECAGSVVMPMPSI
jgi:site-specific recombinase XerD